jgi:hypothetical protein
MTQVEASILLMIFVVLDHIMKGDMVPRFIRSEDMLADSFTKVQSMASKPYSGPTTRAGPKSILLEYSIVPCDSSNIGYACMLTSRVSCKNHCVSRAVCLGLYLPSCMYIMLRPVLYVELLYRRYSRWCTVLHHLVDLVRTVLWSDTVHSYRLWVQRWLPTVQQVSHCSH